MISSQLQVAARRGARLLPVLLSASLLAKSQTLAPSNSLIVKVVPQHLVMSGYWVEVEQQRQQHPRQSFTLTPQLYLGTLGHPNGPRSYPYVYWPQVDVPRENERVRGFGLQGQHRFYLKDSQRAPYPTGFYVSYGPHLQIFQIVYDKRQWQEVQKSGLTYYEFGLKQHTATINRYGASVQVGYQAPLLPGRVSLDLYAGVGLRQSSSTSASAESRYRSGRSDYAHRGWYFPGGVKVGVALH
ncbi:hypothetical protein [Hymenobacter sp. GOD-10R]|uniref:hypothetical protein n=1 Tax=Hymenobacter sp. GOD-10R TaxID=3093922 RepID=UPI002D78D77F|nr:hypothetical protein [Hymenobacter sp. GOD-10R]WRQ26947.1 hypothetical protein SD425_17890 [Hymenobacter sp. GOD-10R]